MVRAGAQRDGRGRSRTRSFRSSFLYAFSSRIGQRLRGGRRRPHRRHRHPRRRAGARRGKPDRERSVDDLMDRVFPELRSRSVRISNGWAGPPGRSAADRGVVGRPARGPEAGAAGGDPFFSCGNRSVTVTGQLPDRSSPWASSSCATRPSRTELEENQGSSSRRCSPSSTPAPPAGLAYATFRVGRWRQLRARRLGGHRRRHQPAGGDGRLPRVPARHRRAVRRGAGGIGGHAGRLLRAVAGGPVRFYEAGATIQAPPASVWSVLQGRRRLSHLGLGRRAGRGLDRPARRRSRSTPLSARVGPFPWRCAWVTTGGR